MCRINREGCIGQHTLIRHEETAENRHQFRRLLYTRRDNTGDRIRRPHNRFQRRQRYRLTGGVADGVLCEVEGEEGMMMHVRLSVPDAALYSALLSRQAQLRAELVAGGIYCTLEVIFADSQP